MIHTWVRGRYFTTMFAANNNFKIKLNKLFIKKKTLIYNSNLTGSQLFWAFSGEVCDL